MYLIYLPIEFTRGVSTPTLCRERRAAAACSAPPSTVPLVLFYAQRCVLQLNNYPHWGSSDLWPHSSCLQPP